MDPSELLHRISDVAREAGAAAMVAYRTDFGIRHKGDRSPVTDADERAEAVILERLAALTPDIPVISEEQARRPRSSPTGHSGASIRSTAPRSSSPATASSPSTSR